MVLGLACVGCGGSGSSTKKVPTSAAAPNSSKVSSIEACLRARGLAPKPAVTSPGARYTNINVPLAKGSRSVIVVFASEQEARSNAAPIFAYLRSGGAQYAQHGQTIVAYFVPIPVAGQPRPPPEASRLESCT
jgi:hypothetical protein